VPPRHFAVTWEFGGGVSWVNVTLSSESPEKTRLELEHIARVDDHWKKFGPGAVGVGWELGLLGLALHLESGQGLDPAQFETWSSSDTGKAFARQSSEGWGNAAIASGASEDDARAAQARTTAAYTGEDGSAPHSC
jgi:hypothetical protein